MSDAYIGLYTMISLLGSEAVAIGVLFGIGILYFKKRSTSETSSATASKKKRLNAKEETEYEVNSSTSSLLDSLQLNSSTPIVVIKLD
jgi:hypothetical protein